MIYTIIIEGHLRDKWADWLNGMVICIGSLNDESKDTTITIQVPDQAALRGIMNKLWDLNLTLLSVISQDTSAVGRKYVPCCSARRPTA